MPTLRIHSMAKMVVKTMSKLLRSLLVSDFSYTGSSAASAMLLSIITNMMMASNHHLVTSQWMPTRTLHHRGREKERKRLVSQLARLCDFSPSVLTG